MQPEIILVIVLRRIEFRKSGYFGYDRFVVGLVFVQLLLIVLRLLPLLFIMVKDHAAVLRAYIISLPVEAGGIMHFPEYFQQFVIADGLGVINDLETFRMARRPAAHLFIRRIGDLSSGIAGYDFNYSLQFLENRFRTPEASCSKSGRVCLCSLGHISVAHHIFCINKVIHGWLGRCRKPGQQQRG